MIVPALLLLAGLLLVIKGGALFVAAAARIAEFLRMPRVVIGSTLVSLATTTPELVVSIMAGSRGESGLAVGNAVGSVICNIGLTLVAVGTSLPELVTALTSSRQSFSDLAVGNVLGANIANLTLIVGTAAVIQDVRMDRLTQVFNFPAMLAVMAVFLGMLLTDRQVTRREGVVLLASYGLYLAALVTLTVWQHGP